MPNSRSVAKTKTKNKDVVKQTKLIPTNHDKPKNLAIAGLVGLILAYIVGSRALDTGSYWEYLFTVVVLVVSIRLFIRSLRLK